MEEITIKLVEVEDAQIRQSKEGNEYIRVTFKAKNEKQEEICVKTSVSINQWQSLSELMDVQIIDDETIITKNPIEVTFDGTGKTNSKKPKRLFKQEIDTYEGYDYNYFELQPVVLIMNKIIERENFKKNYTRLLNFKKK